MRRPRDRRSPKDLTDADWEDVTARIARGETFGMAADAHGVIMESLRKAAMKRGIKTRNKNRTMTQSTLLPKGMARENPELRKMLTDVARESGESDPEKILVACRNRILRIIDAIDHNFDPKWEGMPNLGHATNLGEETTGEHDLKRKLRRYSQAAAEEQMGLRELVGLLKDVAKLENERLGYYKPKLAAQKVEHSGSVDLTTKSDEELIRIIEGTDDEERVH